MLPFTLKYRPARSEYFASPNPILKDKYISHTSLYNGSCHRHVHTNRPGTPISKYSSTDVSILNIDRWISKIYTILLYLSKYCTYVQYHEFSLSSQLPKLVLCTHVSSTVIQLTTPSLLGYVTYANILLSC